MHRLGGMAWLLLCRGGKEQVEEMPSFLFFFSFFKETKLSSVCILNAPLCVLHGVKAD